MVPISCPEELRDPELLGQNRVVSLEEYNSLRQEIEHYLREKQESAGDLQPGDMLQPAYLDVPSYPTADFLWSFLGSVVV